jgi:hypothetical protein
MDTAEVASIIGTSARVLRQFLRSDHSTFVPVGSGARYDFTDRELPTIKSRFFDWQQAGKPKPSINTRPPESVVKARKTKLSRQLERDQQVWAEEGEVFLPDIRDPRVRARARADAKAAEDRLCLRLMAAGLHITQPGFNARRKKVS